MELTLTSKHELLGSGYFIGVDNENISEQLIINIEPDELLDKWAYIEFQVNDGDKYNTPRIDIVDRQIIYDLPNGVLEKGYVKIQVIFRDDTNFLWKSFEKKFHVSDAINACQNLPDEYPDFITEAQKLLDEVSIDAAKIDEVIETEEARVEAENIRVENENNRIANENNRSNAEQTRSTAEATRKSNEETRQSNEVARVNAESQRETKFNTWEGTLGVLDNLSNALKNTASGEVIRVDDVSPVEHNVKIEVLSNNYFIVPTEQTINGVTLTIDENGIIHLNGTCTTDGYFQESVVLPKNGMYYFADFATGTFPSNSSVRTQIYDDVNVVSLPILNNASLNAIVGKEFKNTKVWCRIRVTNGFTYNDCTLKPTLCYGKEPTEYTPYVDPTSVTVTRCGKNLWNKDWSTDITKWQNSTKQPGYLETSFKVGAGNIVTFYYPQVLELGLGFYVGIADSITESADKWLYHSTSQSFINNTITFTAKEDFIYFRVTSGGVTSGTFAQYLGNDLQIELTEKVTDYETYKGETYTPNADGTLTIASTAPTMTLLTDKSGVNIDLEYNQDIHSLQKQIDNIEVGDGADLTNYYTKNETYSQREVDNLISKIPTGGGSSSIPIVEISGSNITLEPNKHYIINGVTNSLTISLSESITTELKHYSFEFTTIDRIPKITINGVDQPYSYEYAKYTKYLCEIVNNHLVILGAYDGFEYQFVYGLYASSDWVSSYTLKNDRTFIYTNNGNTSNGTYKVEYLNNAYMITLTFEDSNIKIANYRDGIITIDGATYTKS